MARINLLPWRAERRKSRQKEFAGMLGLSALAGILVAFLIVSLYNGRISSQNRQGCACRWRRARWIASDHSG